MHTLKLFSGGISSIPTATGWYLADLGEAIGKQQLFTKQSPQTLRVLKESALIESAVASNRIEGVQVDQKRIGTLMFGRPAFRDRDEEEVRGYRDALHLIHSGNSTLRLSESTIQRLHRLIRGDVWDAGRYKEQDGDIIETYPDGRRRIRFKPVAARETPDAMKQLIGYWNRCRKERWVPPLLGLAAFNLDFLCIHPFRDGNGRVSRLLLLLQCYHVGIEVGRYISMERLIEQNKDRYYETLEQGSKQWHQGKHNPWPFINHILFILKQAYREFEQRVSRIGEPRGAKRNLVLETIDRQTGPFSVSQLRQQCPSVGIDMIRKILKARQSNGEIHCLGRGRNALWQRSSIRKNQK